MALVSIVRELSGITAVDLRVAGHLEVHQTDTEAQTLTTTADERVLKRLSSRVEGRRLVLELSVAWWRWIYWWLVWVLTAGKSAAYELSLPTLEEVRITGAASARSSGLRGERLALEISGRGKASLELLELRSLEIRVLGSGDVRVSGTADHQEITINGSGSVSGAGMRTRVTAISISGSGAAEVNAIDTLEVRMTAKGRVKYVGYPRVSKQISRDGKVTPLD
jgi:hypothetical protein